jgi:hypothetical protein
MKQRKAAAAGATAFVILMFICPAVGAEINFIAWGRGVVTPLAWTTDEDGTHSSVSAATFTSGDRPNIGFTANGIAPSGQIGFRIDLAYGNGEAGIGDNAKVWVKPFEIFTLTSGFFKEEELRGKIGASEFAAWILPNSGKNEDNIFQRFDAFAGAHFKLEPLKWLDTRWNGLTIQGAFGSNAPGAPGNNVRAILNLFNNEDNNTLPYKYDESDEHYNGDRKMSALDVFKAIQIAASYDIPDIGLFRAQFIGNNRNVYRWTSEEAGFPSRETRLVTGMNTNRDADIIEAAFCFSRIEGLVLDAGTKIPMKYTTRDSTLILYPQVIDTTGQVHTEINNGNGDNVTIQQPYVIALGASWTPEFFDNLNIKARADMFFGEKITISSVLDNSDSVKITKGLGLSAWLMPSYRILNNFTFGLDFGMESHAEDTVWLNGIGNAPKTQTKPSRYFDIGGGLWGELNLGGGNRVRVGFVMMVPGTVRYRNNQSHPLVKYSPQFRAKPVFSIPISFTYSI